MKLCFSIIILAIGLASCEHSTKQTEVSHVIVDKFTKRPVSIHEEISRKHYGVLENGDTVPVTESQQIGDTIKYLYYHVEN